MSTKELEESNFLWREKHFNMPNSEYPKNGVKNKSNTNDWPNVGDPQLPKGPALPLTFNTCQNCKSQELATLPLRYTTDLILNMHKRETYGNTFEHTHTNNRNKFIILYHIRAQFKLLVQFNFFVEACLVYLPGIMQFQFFLKKNEL